MKNISASTGYILQQFDLRRTKPRELVLHTFLKHNNALDYSMLNRCIGQNIDRGTIYRTLYLFLEKGLLHTVPSADGIIHYVLQTNKSVSTYHKHMHFMCSQCNKLYCLLDSPVPEIKLPKAFTANNLEVVINGICKNCRTGKND